MTLHGLKNIQQKEIIHISDILATFKFEKVKDA